jgi:hypothetical protein
MEFQAKDTIQFLARQEGKRVYRYDQEAQAEVLMVDYSLEVDGHEVIRLSAARGLFPSKTTVKSLKRQKYAGKFGVLAEM